MENSKIANTKLEKFFSKKRVIILAALWLVTNLAFHFGPWSTTALAEVSGGKGIPDIMFSYNLQTLQELFQAYGPEGIAIYKNLQILDFVYPLIYGALLLGLLIRVQIPRNIRPALYGNPFIIVLFDYSENLILRHLINVFPNLDSSYNALASLASLLTLLKWSFIISTILAILFFWIRGFFIKSNT